MCGRFFLSTSSEELASAFEIEPDPNWHPRYNIAPGTLIPSMLMSGSGRQFTPMHWGLIPSWSKDPKISSKLINARSETAAEKPSFRNAYKKRHCLILTDGYYEWQKVGKQKQPYVIRMKDERPFAIAGLWEQWVNVTTCTILTTAANDLTQPIHDRMPVIIKPKDYDAWLDVSIRWSGSWPTMLQPFDSEAMCAYPVSTQVNLPQNDSVRCLERLNI